MRTYTRAHTHMHTHTHTHTHEAKDSQHKHPGCKQGNALDSQEQLVRPTRLGAFL